MSVIYKKTRKLIRNPKAFFIDSKIFKRSNDSASLILKSEITKTEKIIVPSKNKKTNNLVKVYLSEAFSKDHRFINHIIRVFSDNVILSIGEYKLKLNEILFSYENDVLLANLNHTIVDGILTKGNLLVTTADIECSRQTSPKILDAIHKINVQHMKSLGDFNMLYYYYSDRKERTEVSQVKYALSAGIYKKEVIDNAIIILEEKMNVLSQGDVILFLRNYIVYLELMVASKQ
ncbi:hypothetical protein [Atlantibacter sp.]|uniref:hypothetical protein n=1 Tax=Atlantibacter sp. TaxID=1903473 RepID=UPI0028AB6499|nr:hypothetical protein [Atlantibacter sp.]